MSAPSVNVAATGTTIVVTVENCPSAPTVNPSAGTPTKVVSGNTITYTYMNVPANTYDINVDCGKESFPSQVTIPAP